MLKKIGIILIAILIIFVISGCDLGTANSSDTIELYNRSSTTDDNSIIYLPEGYFNCGYEEVVTGDNTMDVIIHFKKVD